MSWLHVDASAALVGAAFPYLLKIAWREIEMSMTSWPYCRRLCFVAGGQYLE